MRYEFEGESAAPIRFFHICTDGTHNGIVHFDDEDYIMANKICAINAHKHDVHIICSVHMSTHSHFVVWTDNYDKAERFAEAYKRDYSRYLATRHGIRSAFEGVDCKPIPINDIFYLKRCICYVLLNPVTAGIVKSPELYRWSSFAAYFNAEDDGVIDVASLSIGKCRTLMHSRAKLTDSKLKLTATGEVSLKSFIDYKFVENFFGNQTSLFKSLAMTNCADEEQIYVNHTVKYDDTELIAEIISLTTKRYGKSEFRMLTKSEKLSIVPAIVKKTKASPKRLARILRISDSEINAILGQ